MSAFSTDLRRLVEVEHAEILETEKTYMRANWCYTTEEQHKNDE